MRLRRIGIFLSVAITMALLVAIMPALPVMAALGTITITAPSPAYVGSTVTINSGTGFTVGATYTVLVNGIQAVVTSSAGSATTIAAGGLLPVPITFIVPAVPVGSRAVTVTTNAPDTCTPVTFNVTPKILPNIASVSVGGAVTIIGSGYTAGATATVSFDTTTVSTAVPIDANGSFTVNLTVPRTSAGSHVITAIDSSAYNANTSISVSPSITSNATVVTVGAQLTITGAGFSANSNISIFINSVLFTSSHSDAFGAYTYTLTVPENVRNNYTLTTYDSLGYSASASFAIVPAVTVNPASFTSGSQVTINGTGFAATSNISTSIDSTVINANAATTSNLGSLTLSNFTVPALAGGSHTFQVTDASNNTATLTFSVTQSIVISPESGPPGTTVQVTGKSFSPNVPVAIYFDGNGVATTPVSPPTDATGNVTATFVVPPGAGGAHQVQVSDGSFTADAAFNITATAAITPVTGPVSTSVTVNGSSFASRSTISITFDGNPVPGTSADANGKFTTSFNVPPSPAGVHVISITDGTRTVNFNFAVVASVTIDPAAGVIGTAITVNGYGFNATAQISLKYDDTPITTLPATASGGFTCIFKAPVSQGGNHSIIATDGTSTLVTIFAMDSTPPPTPILTTPSNGIKAPALTEFGWKAVTDPSGVTYTLQVSRDPNFNVLLIEEKNLTSQGYLLTQAQKLSPASRSKPYYWRVMAIDGASNESPWSNVWFCYVGFVLPIWALYFIFGVAVVLAFMLGTWFGGMRQRTRGGTPKIAAVPPKTES